MRGLDRERCDEVAGALRTDRQLHGERPIPGLHLLDGHPRIVALESGHFDAGPPPRGERDHLGRDAARFDRHDERCPRSEPEERLQIRLELERVGRGARVGEHRDALNLQSGIHGFGCEPHDDLPPLPRLEHLGEARFRAPAGGIHPLDSQNLVPLVTHLVHDVALTLRVEQAKVDRL